MTIIDGAHAPGQIGLNLPEIEADFYIGACHKWLSAPKGSGFLYARPDAQKWLTPVVISGGWMELTVAWAAHVGGFVTGLLSAAWGKHGEREGGG